MEGNNKYEEAQIMSTVRQLADLMIKRDTEAMNEILDENYTLTLMTGYVQSGSEWYVEVEKKSMKYYAAKEVNCTVTIKENNADVTVQNLVDARIWGSRNTWRLQQKIQLEKQNGKWVILKSVASIF